MTSITKVIKFDVENSKLQCLCGEQYWVNPITEQNLVPIVVGSPPKVASEFLAPKCPGCGEVDRAFEG